MAFIPSAPIRSSALTHNQVCVSGSAFIPARPPASRPIPIPRSTRHNHLRRGPPRAPTMQAVDVQTRDVFMPALSSTMTEGKIVQWLKRPGDPVSSGEPIMVVESDKADMDVESFEDGFLAAVLVEEGESAPVGSIVALIVDSKEDISKVSVSPSASTPSASSSVAAPAAEQPPAPAASNGAADTPAPQLEKPDFSEVFMPALSSTMTEGKVVDWLKSEGDAVQSGEMIMVVESDKADMDVEAFDDGILAHISVQNGESSPVGSAVAYLAKSADQVAAVKAWAVANTGASPSPAAAAQNGSPAALAATPAAPATQAPPATPAPPTAKVVNEGRIVASPWAKTVAKDHGVDLRYVTGTGPGGRIVEKDVLAFAKSGSAPPAASAAATPGKVVATPDAKKVAKKEGIDLATVTGTGNFGRITADDVLRAAGKAPEPAVAKATSEKVAATVVPAPAEAKQVEKMPGGSVVMNSAQKAVVKNMNASLTVPVFRITYEICTTKLDELYSKVKPKGVTMSALLAKAVASALRKHPIMNAAYADNAIVYREDINVAMAVSTPDGGLITPTLKKADEVDLYSLSRTWKDLVKKATDKKLAPEEYSGGTFAISNLGMFGVEQFDAILPPGMPGILAIGAAKPTVRMMDNGMVGVEKVMNVTLTADHRHIYGAEGAKFLKDLAKVIEGDVMQLLM